MIYFDYAAATPVDPEVLRVMRPFFSERFYNPSAAYLAAKAVRETVEQVRGRVAMQLGAKPAEIIFTAGGTESDNLAIHGIMRKYPNAGIVTSAVEHDAVLEPAKQYAHKYARVSGQGVVDLKDLERQIDDNTVLVSVMYANNEIGTVQPVRKIAQLIAKIRQRRRSDGIDLPLYLHTDACQAANYLDIHVSRLGVDLLTLNGGKIYGPKQSGILYVATGIELEPLVYGGGQERGKRSGTENVAACIGFAEALELVQHKRQNETKRLMELQALAYKLTAEKLPSARINGSLKYRLPNNIHLTLPGQDNERLLMELDERGIMAAAGSACSASDDEPSHVLGAIGMSEADAQSSLRITMGQLSVRSDVIRLFDILAELTR